MPCARHADAIGTFLAAHGIGNVGVHVAPKGMPKGDFIRATFFADGPEAEATSGHGAAAIFADDDIRELVASEWLREHPDIHRVLFVRVLD